MKKVLKKGFTLIELMVVIAIIGILATTLAPKLREQLAKAKDSKAVSFLGASRTVASSLIITQMTSDSDDSGKDTVGITGQGLHNQMDANPEGLISTSGGLIIGGSRPSADAKVNYGGTVSLISGTSKGTNNVVDLITTSSSGAVEIKDASDLHLIKSVTTDTSTEGKEWTAY